MPYNLFKKKKKDSIRFEDIRKGIQETNFSAEGAFSKGRLRARRALAARKFWDILSRCAGVSASIPGRASPPPTSPPIQHDTKNPENRTSTPCEPRRRHHLRRRRRRRGEDFEHWGFRRFPARGIITLASSVRLG